MRLMLDANVLLDCVVLETTGLPRAGKAASDQMVTLCDEGVHHGMVAWHTLPIVAYYHGRQHDARDTMAMMDALMLMLQVPTVTHQDAMNWLSMGCSILKMPCRWPAPLLAKQMCLSLATRPILSARVSP